MRASRDVVLSFVHPLVRPPVRNEAILNTARMHAHSDLYWPRCQMLIVQYAAEQSLASGGG